MKSFTQTYTDCQNITKDSSTDTLALFKTWINDSIHKVLSLSDWNFNKDAKTYTSVAQQQDYDTPYNAAKIDYVRIYMGGVYYTPKEIKSGTLWQQINYVPVYSDVPQLYHISNRTRKICIYPIPSSTDQTIKIGYTKRVRDLSVADYTTGTITTVANDNTITGAGVTWVNKMAGRYINITNTSEVIGGMWLEIVSLVPASSTLEVRENMPVAVVGASYTIAEMIPFMDGFEDIAYWYALDKFYQMKEMPTMAREYERMWKESLDEMLARDLRSCEDVLEKETPVEILDPNTDSWAIQIIP